MADKEKQSKQTSINAKGAQIGIIGDFAQIGEVHFHVPPEKIPLQRPTRAQYFIGRQQELQKLLADLQPGRVVTLCGPGGIGKTALAAEAVWALTPDDKPPDRFPDGIIYYSFYGRSATYRIFEHIIRSFNENTRDISAAAVQRTLAGKQFLLILDGTEEAEDLSAVLRLRSNCAVLITSRQRKDALANRQDIAPLQISEAVTLLQKWAKGRGINTIIAERICEKVGRLPLAVRLVGRYLTETDEPADDYLAWLTATPIEALSQGDHKEESVELLLQRSLSQVDKQAQQVLGLIGQMEMVSFEWEGIRKALDLEENIIRRIFNELVSYGLLLRQKHRFVVSHALIHVFSRRRLIVDTTLLIRLLAYYGNLVQVKYKPGLDWYLQLADDNDLWKDIEHLHQLFLQLLKWLMKHHAWGTVISLVRASDFFLTMPDYWDNRQLALEAGIIASRPGDQYAESSFLINLGELYQYRGDLEKAVEYYKQSLTIAQEIDHRENQGIALGYLGMAYYALGQLEKAVKYLKQSLTIARELGSRQSEGAAVGNLGIIYTELGELKQALEYHEQALAISRKTGNRKGESGGLNNLGILYAKLEKTEQAIDYYERALLISIEIGDLVFLCNQCDSLGSAYASLGRINEAIMYQEAAVEGSRALGDKRGESLHSWNLGLLYEESEPERTIALMSVRVTYERELGHPDAEIHAQRVARIQARLEKGA